MVVAFSSPPDPRTVAIVYDADGVVYDHCWSWGTGQNYSNQGYRVVAVADDVSERTGHVLMTVDEAQRLYDYEREIAADCFGPGIRDWS